MVFERLIVGGLESNCYILKSVDIAIIIDPGAEPDKIIKAVSGIEIQLILATHGHYDHIDALTEVKKATGAQAAIHSLDWTHGFDLKLQDGQIIEFGDEKLPCSIPRVTHLADVALLLAVIFFPGIRYSLVDTATSLSVVATSRRF